jgi:hypothetical protein
MKGRMELGNTIDSFFSSGTRLFEGWAGQRLGLNGETSQAEPMPARQFDFGAWISQNTTLLIAGAVIAVVAVLGLIWVAKK